MAQIRVLQRKDGSAGDGYTCVQQTVTVRGQVGAKDGLQNLRHAGQVRPLRTPAWIMCAKAQRPWTRSIQLNPAYSRHGRT
eukprot:362057-Chlamydomonas_euryale.AAC.3